MSAARGQKPSEVHAKRLVELGAAIAESALDRGVPMTRASYERLLSDIAGAVGATRMLSYQPVPDGDGWGWEFASYWSVHAGGARELAALGDLLRARRVVWSFTPQAAPEIGQRNRVLSTREAPFRSYAPTLRALGDATGARANWSHALRVLLCDGPRVLACVGCLRDLPFDEHQRAALQALVPSLAQAHRVERATRERVFLSAGLEAALEIIAEPAFLLDRRGVIRHANRVGERWMARCQNAAERITAVARGASFDGVAHRLPDAGGAVVIMRTGGRRPSTRLRRARDAWDLTPRQVEVLGYLVDGQTNKEAAAHLRCTPSNVELHVTNILRRSGSANRAELVSKFWQL